MTALPAWGCIPMSTTLSPHFRHWVAVGEHLLLDGVQDAPHVLIHLQALKQSGFTGKKREAVLGLCSWTLETRGTTQPSPQGQRASASAAGSFCRSDRRRLAHDSWVTAPVSKLLCKVWVLRWAFRAGAGGWTPQRLGGEAPARVGVTHLHTGHLQVPLSQFSCRYDSRSKHCRGQETSRQTRR